MSSYSFSLNVNILRNVIYIRQSGQATVDDLRGLKREFLAGLDQVKPGFAIVNDQRELAPFDAEAMEVARELVELTNEHGAAKVIRIVPKDLVSKVKLSSTLISAKNRYTNIRVATPEEAEAALDSD